MPNMSQRAADVVIVGGGVIGLACAWYLLKAGRSVVVLERGRPGDGASHGNCGTITPSHAPPLPEPGVIGRALKWILKPDAPLYIPPRLDTALWHWLMHFAVTLQCPRPCKRGPHPRGAVERLTGVAGGTARGNRHRMQLRADRLAVRVPGPRLPGTPCPPARCAGAARHSRRSRGMGRARSARNRPCAPAWPAASVFPDDACLRPDRLVAGLAHAVRAAGGEIIEQAPVDRFESRIAAHIARARLRHASLGRTGHRARCRCLVTGPCPAARRAAAHPARQGLLDDLSSPDTRAAPCAGA
jgi:D-amino-acid dehydrogenase